MGQSAACKKKNNKLLKVQNLNINSKSFSRKQNVSPDNVFVFETTYNTGDIICGTQAVIECHVPAISLLPLPRFEITCDLRSKL